MVDSQAGHVTRGREVWMLLQRFLLVFAVFVMAAYGQTVTGTISGTVVDQSDAVVPNANVTLTNNDTAASRKTTTGSSGEFVFTATPPGNYTVLVEAAGFQATRVNGVTLPTGVRLAVGSVRLIVGQATQSVAVSAEGERVSTESADVSNRVNQRQFSDMTIKGRDPLALIRTMPGVTSGVFVNAGERSETDPAGLSSNGGIYGSLTPNISGGRMFWNTVTVDGQVSGNPDWPGLMMSAISVEAVAEMKVTSANFTAEYGRNLGSNITMVTRSGTRDFHGSAYWFKRHEQFNANNFFNNRNGLTKPKYRYNTIGFTVGGPVTIPKVFNTGREKLFFFYSQEEWRTQIPIDPFLQTVPTDRERRGDFSQTLEQNGALVSIVDPTNRQAFPGNVIPPSRINPNGQAILNVIPLPNQLDRNVTKGAYNYQWQDVCTDPKRLQGLKTDYVPNSNDRISIGLRRWWSDVRAFTCNTLGYSGLPLLQHHYNYTTDNALLNWTHVFGATRTNEFSIGGVGEKERGPVPGPYPERAGTYFDSVTRAKAGYKLGQFFGEANPFALIPQASFGGVPNAANIAHDPRLPGDQGYSRFTLADRFSWVRSGHTLKFGVDFEWNFANDGPSSSCGDGCFDFGRNTNNPLDSNWAYSNALLGNFATYTETNNRPKYRYERKNWEFFAQDTWKVNRKLTLNYGLRFAAFTNWDLTIGKGAAFILEDYSRAKISPLFQPALDSANRRVARDPVSGNLFPAVYIGAFVPAVGDPFAGTSLTSDKRRTFLDQQPLQVMPRFGFAFDPTGSGKTAIRGGFGVTKLSLPTYGSGGHIERNAPAQLSPQVFYGSMDTLFNSSAVVFPGNTGTFPRTYKTPSMYNYSLSIQRSFGASTVVDISYVGNVGRHLLQTVNLNVLPYGARFQASALDSTTGRPLPDVFLRPIPGYQNITARDFSGISNYNSLQASANRRMARGVQVGASYTWAKNQATGSGENGLLPTYLSPRIWVYGPTLWDQTQMLVLNYVWELPKPGKALGVKALGYVLDNWTWSGVTTVASGFPKPVSLSTTDGADLTGGGDGVRPLMVSGAHLAHGERTLERWFNTAAFARPPVGSYGNTPVAPVRGPGYNNWDMTLLKRFPVYGEGRFLEFRWEMFNAFNHTQFTDIDTTARFNPAGQQVNARFGQAFAARPSRIMQAALKFNF